MTPRTVRWGVSPIAWTNDDLPELGGETPLETCLAEAAEAGFSGIELGGKFPREAGALRRVLVQHGLDLVSGWYGARLLERTVEEEIAHLEPHLTLLHALGCDVLVFAEVARAVHGDRAVPLSRRPRLGAGEMERLARATTELAEHTASRGVRLAVHHHMGTVIQTAEEIDALLRHAGAAVSLLLDTGHLAWAGADPVAVARRHAGRIVHVHAKDVRPDVLGASLAADRPFLEGVLAGTYTVPGDGTIDYAAVLAPLCEAGYAGWLVVEAEQDPARAHPLTYAKSGRAALAAAAERAGFAAAP